MFLDEAVEHRRAQGPFDAAESLDLVDCQVEARHLEIFRPNTFTDVVHRSHNFDCAAEIPTAQRTVLSVCSLQGSTRRVEPSQPW